jgi:hypothetical protein
MQLNRSIPFGLCEVHWDSSNYSVKDTGKESLV